MGFNGIYPLVMTNIAMVEPWPIEMDGLPFLKMGDFPWQTVSHNQRVPISNTICRLVYDLNIVIFRGYVRLPDGRRYVL